MHPADLHRIFTGPCHHLTSAASTLDHMDNGVRQRVLVVEDEPTINQAVADRLTAEGFDVRQAYDGPGAVALAGQWAPALLVLDVMLPGFDGHEVCRRVQAE